MSPSVHKWSQDNFTLAVEKTRSIFPDLMLFNLHAAEQDMTSQFFCRVLPEARHLCKTLESLPSQTREDDSNVANPIVYDQLAVAALRKVWFWPKAITRGSLRWELERHVPLDQLGEMPLDCLSKEEEQNLTIKLSFSCGYGLSFFVLFRIARRMNVLAVVY